MIEHAFVWCIIYMFIDIIVKLIHLNGRIYCVAFYLIEPNKLARKFILCIHLKFKCIVNVYIIVIRLSFGTNLCRLIRHNVC